MMAEYVAYLAEGIAALIITIGALKALWIYMRWCVLSRTHARESYVCRIELGHSLSLGLEFLVGADILKTAVAPDWSVLGQLGAIIAIRTMLNFFLTWELEKIERSVEYTEELEAKDSMV